jgi:hypothetical protein
MDWYTTAGPNLLCNVCDCKVSRGSVDEHEAGRRHRDNLTKAQRKAANLRLQNQRQPPQPSAPASGGNRPQRQQQHQHQQPAPSLVQKRQCARCTLLNDPGFRECQACGDSQLMHMPVVMVTMGEERTNCTCPGCGANSPIDAPRCFICGYSLTAHASGVAADDDDDEDVKIVSGGGRPAAASTHVAVDDEEEDECMVCMAAPATYGFVPCGHIVLCAGCRPNFAGTRECFTCRTKVQRITQMSKKAAPARGLAVKTRAHPSAPAGHPAHGTNPNPSRNWQHVGSTFPWIGGESDAWPRFVREIEAAAAAYVKLELGGRYPQAHVKRCDWSADLVDRLKQGWCQHACPEGAWAGMFGWHGSKRGVSAINAIARKGWDPATRSRNAHGTGDYFAVHHSQAVEYALDAGSKGRTSHGDTPMLLAFILRGEHLTWVEDYCMICANPTDVPMSFAFPMITVHFTQQDPPDQWVVPRFPYRWQFGWEKDRTENPSDDDDDDDDDTYDDDDDDTSDDDQQQQQWVTVQSKSGEYHPYEHAVNMQLNEAMCRFYASKRNANNQVEHTMTYSTERHDGVHTDYVVDFAHMTQTNLDTQFLRKINIEPVPPARLPKTLWMMLRDAAEIDRQDAAVTHGANRHRHDYAKDKSNAPGGGQGANSAAAEQFWLVLDMFSQRQLSRGYFQYHGQPCSHTGQILPSRRNQRARYAEVTVHKTLMRADFDRMLLQVMTWDNRKRQQVPEEPGWPLAVVDA